MKNKKNARLNLDFWIYEIPFVMGALHTIREDLKKIMDEDMEAEIFNDYSAAEGFITVDDLGRRLIAAIIKQCEEKNIEFPAEKYRKKWEEHI